MSDKSNATSGGIGLGMVLFLIFMILKLCDKIDWSWWWVTCPLWGPFALILCVLVIAALIYMACCALGHKPRRRN